jgi:hypothetical protein
MDDLGFATMIQSIENMITRRVKKGFLQWRNGRERKIGCVLVRRKNSMGGCWLGLAGNAFRDEPSCAVCALKHDIETSG